MCFETWTRRFASAMSGRWASISSGRVAGSSHSSSARCLASVGIAGGALLAAFAARGLRTFLLDVSPFDPLTYLVVSVALVGVCVLASLIPARRAMRVDPIVALRAE